MQELYLYENKIGDPGVTALAKACATGALASVTILSLGGNQIDDAGVIAPLRLPVQGGHGVTQDAGCG